MNKKQKEQLIKYSRATTIFFWVFSGLFIILTIAGMVYSYMNLVGLAFEMSYPDNPWKAGFWPLFTEITMVVLGLLVLVVRLNKWPRLTIFKIMTYAFSLIVILANAFHTSVVSAGWTMSSAMDLGIQELPVIVYLIFLEVSLYVVTNVMQDKVAMSDNTQKNSFESTSETAERATEAHMKNTTERKQQVKSFICQVVHNGDDITQERIGEIVGLERQTVSAYYNELVAEGALLRQGKGQYSLNGESNSYLVSDVSQWLSEVTG